MHTPSDTIHALASAAGKAGVAVVRISGPRAIRVVEALTHADSPTPRRLSLRRLYRSVDVQKRDRLDEAMIVVMPGPNSFTGEDCAELHLHGGFAIIQSVLDAIFETGLSRLAQPGEFSRRAFENGRMDLTQAESVADLIDAETDAQRRQAFDQYEGSVQTELSHWRDLLIQAMASLEAEIDFPDEEDVPDAISSRAYGLADRLVKRIESALQDADRSLAVREGFKIAIIGKPNAGKSSLLNAITKKDTAIVSDIPGTTRDAIEARMVINGYVVWFVDTAGLRETEDRIEAEGVRRARSHAENADLRILVTSPDELDAQVELLMSNDIVVLNKIDVAKTDDQQVHNTEDKKLKVFKTQADIGVGVDQIIDHLAEFIAYTLSSASSPVITRERHRSHIAAALDHVKRSMTAMRTGLGPELASEDLRLAARELGAVTGDVDVEDLLDKIFSEFCIGK